MTFADGGLTAAEAKKRLADHGPNALPEPRGKPIWRRVLDQFRSPLIYILLFALAIDLVFWVREGAEGLPFESIAIALILFLNAALGVFQERKAEAALSRLKRLSAPLVWARRDGDWRHVVAAELVPGDLVRIEAGDRVPADGVAVHSDSASVDESLLTGESLPVDKSIGDEFFSGTLLVRGRSHLVLSGTGLNSALGKLAKLLQEVEAESTPLERRMDVFGRRVAHWVLGLAAAMTVGGLAVDGVDRIGEILVFSVALAVAAVPEGLPAVLTFTLALGVERMARRKAVVRKLSAVEALGSVTVIATDKTGTITENLMHVRQVESRDADLLLRAMVLANDAEGDVGDPMDVALLRFAREKGLDPVTTVGQFPRVASRPFDSATKSMEVTVAESDGQVTYLKGAHEVLLSGPGVSPEERRYWDEKAAAFATDGLRVLGFARRTESGDKIQRFIGLAAMGDPPRPEVPSAIASAQDAGIRVLMVTGDHPATAAAVARQVGIRADRVVTGTDLEGIDRAALSKLVQEVDVFARVRPEHKLRLVEALQASGQVVAMTGDGVNDAPALKRSDVGVAMGLRGSDVAREVADLVLLDDNFATIVSATEEGRSIYENIQKFIRFLFSTNLSEIIVVALGVVLAFAMGLRDVGGDLLLPLTAVQILWINLVTDGLPALALALDRNPGVMGQTPRPAHSPLLDGPSFRFIVISGSIKGLMALGLLGLLPWLDYGFDVARTVAFQFLAVGQLFFVYPARHTHFRPLRNPTLHVVVVFGVALQILIGEIPATAGALGLTPLPPAIWVLILGCSLLAWGLAEIVNRTLFRGPK